MGVEKILFYCFSLVLITSASMVVTSKNAVRAVLFLILAFFASSGLWILLQAEFLAIVLILVYVGAVMVLFLFVVMLLDMNISPVKEGFVKFMPIGIIASLLIIAQIAYVIGPDSFGSLHVPALTNRAADFSNIKALGDVIFVEYLIHFELAAVILLVSMIAAVCLTFRGPKQRKKQNIAQQVQVKKSDRLKIIKSNK